MTYFSVNPINLLLHQQKHQLTESTCVHLSCSLKYTLLIHFFPVAKKYIASFPKNFDPIQQVLLQLSCDWKWNIPAIPVFGGEATSVVIY